MKQRFMTPNISLALGAATLAAIGLFLVGVLRNQSYDFWYLPYNLALAVIPLLLALWLRRLLTNKRSWSSWLPLVISLLWLAFLPNSFYIVTDFIHLTETPRVDIVQDVVMLMQFSFLGLMAGFISLFILHKEFELRISRRWAAPLVVLLLLLSSLAIYLGRDLRWNSWDIVVQPLKLLADVFNRVVHPLAYPQMYIMTLSFFLMLGTMYAVLWQVDKIHSTKK